MNENVKPADSVDVILVASYIAETNDQWVEYAAAAGRSAEDRDFIIPRLQLLANKLVAEEVKAKKAMTREQLVEMFGVMSIADVGEELEHNKDMLDRLPAGDLARPRFEREFDSLQQYLALLLAE